MKAIRHIVLTCKGHYGPTTTDTFSKVWSKSVGSSKDLGLHTCDVESLLWEALAFAYSDENFKIIVLEIMKDYTRSSSNRTLTNRIIGQLAIAPCPEGSILRDKLGKPDVWETNNEDL
jgi:hypothetical protein